MTVLYPGGEGASTENHGDLVDQLVTTGFGTASSTGTLAASFYQKLVEALLPQAKGKNGDGNGFGRLLVFLNNSTSYDRFALEYYDIDNDAITAVNYWSPGIESEAYKSTDTGTESSSGTGGVRGRLELSNGSFAPNGTFKWTRSVDGTNLPEAED